jgi:hypothetical protein
VQITAKLKERENTPDCSLHFIILGLIEEKICSELLIFITGKVSLDNLISLKS